MSDSSFMIGESEVLREHKGLRFGLVSGDGALPNPDEVSWLPILGRQHKIEGTAPLPVPEGSDYLLYRFQ